VTARPEYVYLALFASEHWEECFVHLILRYSKTCQRSYSIVTDRIELYLTTLTTSTEAARFPSGGVDIRNFARGAEFFFVLSLVELIRKDKEKFRSKIPPGRKPA
jgi:hypothetical protein